MCLFLVPLWKIMIALEPITHLSQWQWHFVQHKQQCTTSNVHPLGQACNRPPESTTFTIESVLSFRSIRVMQSRHRYFVYAIISWVLWGDLGRSTTTRVCVGQLCAAFLPLSLDHTEQYINTRRGTSFLNISFDMLDNVIWTIQLIRSHR